MTDGERGTVAQRVLEALPDWGHVTTQLNAEVARRMGITLSDIDCLRALDRYGPATATALATHVGLTSGSVSRMIDRLDAAGWVKRVRDPGDRRRVLIELTSEGLERVWTCYARMAACTHEDLAGFTEAELAVVLRFIDLVRGSTGDTLARLRSDGPVE